MLSIPTSLMEELHKIGSGGSVIFLAELPAYSLYLARNNEDIVWNGHTWEKCWFDIDGIGEDTNNSKAPEIQVNFSNIGGMIEEQIIAAGNFARAVVNLYIVNTNCLDEADPIYSVSLKVQKVTVNKKIVSFKVGLSNPLMMPFPTWQFHGSICQYFKNGTLFKGPLCGYTGTEFTTCDYSISDCIERGNTERFGAQLGLLGAIQDEL